MNAIISGNHFVIYGNTIIWQYVGGIIGFHTETASNITYCRRIGTCDSGNVINTLEHPFLCIWMNFPFATWDWNILSKKTRWDGLYRFAGIFTDLQLFMINNGCNNSYTCYQIIFNNFCWYKFKLIKYQ